MIIHSLSELIQAVQYERNQGHTIVWTNGCFDLIHPWHIETFNACKTRGDILVVWVNGDNSPYWQTKPGRPINSEYARTFLLDNIKAIDYVFVFNEETPLIPIQAILPDVLIKWGDYIKQDIVWYQEVIQNGGTVETIPTVGAFSTSSIIQKILHTYGK